jgi:cyclopropane fatty-acyl-phospholipid synthase-like methyltransferase
VETSVAHNYTEWTKPYHAPNVQSEIFRWFGHVGSRLFQDWNRMPVSLDFGCGEGSTVQYFHQQGFSSFGVDINKSSLDTALDRYPHLEGKLAEVPFKLESIPFPEVFFDLVTSRNVFYYLPPDILKSTLSVIRNKMNSKSFLYVTMMKVGGYYYKHSKALENNMRRVQFDNGRIKRNTDILFVEDIDHLAYLFEGFELIELGEAVDYYKTNESPGDPHFTATFRLDD